MQITKTQIKFCLDRANEINDLYRKECIGGNSSVKSTDVLRKITSDRVPGRLSVKLLAMAADNQSFKGFFIAKDAGFEICLLDGLNECWKRFVLCKELFHVILDTDEYRNVNFQHLIAEYCATLPIESTDKPSLSAVSEQLATIAAMQFLLPYQDRVILVSNNPNPDYFEIARRYMIPRVYVEKYLSPTYMAKISEFYTVAPMVSIKK